MWPCSLSTWSQVERGRRWGGLQMKPDYAKFAIVLKLGRWHKSIRIPKSKNKMARALPVDRKARLGFPLLPPLSHLLSRPFKTPLSVAAWSEVWPIPMLAVAPVPLPLPLQSPVAFFFTSTDAIPLSKLYLPRCVNPRVQVSHVITFTY